MIVIVYIDGATARRAMKSRESIIDFWRCRRETPSYLSGIEALDCELLPGSIISYHAEPVVVGVI